MASVFCCFFHPQHHRPAPGDLPETERVRAARFLREEDRQRYLLGRTLLRRLCGSHLGLPPAEVPLLETERGKPYLAANTLQFNLAHSGDCVALAWSPSHPVGVDVECLDRGRAPSYRDIARSAFSPAEQEVLAHTSEQELARTFYRIWVRKEAIVKAEGCGIAGALQGFSVARGPAWPREVDFPEATAPWQLQDLAAPPGYLAALALPLCGEVQLLTPDECEWAGFSATD